MTTGPAQCPTYGGFLTHGYDVIRWGGESTVGLQLCGGQQLNPRRKDVPVLSSLTLNTGGETRADVSGARVGACRELEEALG